MTMELIESKLRALEGMTVQLEILEDEKPSTMVYGVLHVLTRFGGYAVQEEGNGDLMCFELGHVCTISVPIPAADGLPEITVRRPKESIRKSEPDFDVVEIFIRKLLQAIGEDPEREGLKDTPGRVARFWKEFIDFEPGNLDTVFEAIHVDEMIIVPNIAGWSLCEHHLLPFSFEAHVGYITGEHVIGLSKIPRIVRKCAHRLQLQERLTNDIADELEKLVKPKGVAVVVKGWHTCMQMRGVEAREAGMITSCMRGVFLGNPVARQEFMDLIK